MHYIAMGIAILSGLGIIFVGSQYLLAPARTAKSFGLPTWPNETSWLNLKGIRDVVSGLSVLIPLALGQFEVAGYLMLAAAITPTGDAMTILRNRGSKAAAYGIHGATALVVIIGGVLFLAG
ncbi:DUF4267 domain-containing protein [Actinocrispum wychmicini]|uniref:Uncharacterized protein DUF4267 n=1 Tax=Actinocrispum wychmicini TaxID=1213861 RepID=A0A4R2K6G2_9PSEU|nr:DUF4267 domain-containing protein [Actinocrispum wychmicini]TCO65506.1 uncharacterized protein DUF4267 [Actinocrispum wychmicini]